MSGAGTDRIDVPGCGRPIAPELRSGEPQSLQAPDAQTPAPRSDCLRPHSSRAGKTPPAPLSSKLRLGRTPLEQRSGSKPLEPSAKRRATARKEIKRAK